MRVRRQRGRGRGEPATIRFTGTRVAPLSVRDAGKGIAAISIDMDRIEMYWGASDEHGPGLPTRRARPQPRISSTARPGAGGPWRRRRRRRRLPRQAGRPGTAHPS
ncbi:hypothetical protein EJK15_45135 [Nonomuraea basaltis]|nr:hypothetical protein EJK15_45135 [Nonomuraea basaltis]